MGSLGAVGLPLALVCSLLPTLSLGCAPQGLGSLWAGWARAGCRGWSTLTGQRRRLLQGTWQPMGSLNSSLRERHELWQGQGSIWAALLQLQVRGEGMCSGSSRQGEQAGQTYRGVNPMAFPHQERFPGVFQNVTPAPSAQPDLNTQRLWVWPPKGRWSENPVSIQSLSEVFPS